MEIAPAALVMIGLDVLMIVYTLWVLSLNRETSGRGRILGASLLALLGLLHVGLSQRLLFPDEMSGLAFLAVILVGVAAVGALLFGVPLVRRLLLALDQRQLLLLQGIRVYFGAAFLAQAATGTLPITFGVVDGISHVSAGFFGLVAAYALAAGNAGVRRAWFANLFGLADILVVASTLALVMLPTIGTHHSMMYAVFLPAPLWLWFHVVSIAGMRRAQVAARPVVQA